MPGRAAISESEGLRPPIGVPLFSGLERNDADCRILDTRIGRTRAELKSLFELTEVSWAPPFLRTIRSAFATIANDFDLTLLRPSRDPRQTTHQLSEIGQRRPDGHSQMPSGRPVRPTGWLSEIYFVDDTVPG
jgi:hypothetical protein